MTTDQSLRGRKVAIGIPTLDGRINSDLVATMMGASMMGMSTDVRFGLIICEGCSIIATARNRIVRSFLSGGGTDLLFLDSDIIVGAPDIMKLIGLATVHPIVAAAYPTREDPPRFIVTPEEGEMEKAGRAGSMVRVKRTGTGCMLIRRHVIEQLWAATEDKAYGDTEGQLHPVFDHVNGRGEDFYFCDLARENGFEIVIDPTIEVGHIRTAVNRGRFADSMNGAG